MSQSILLEVVSPTRTELSREVDYVVAPTPEGLIGVLPGHAPLLTRLDIGVLRFTAHGEVTNLAVSEGYMEVTPHKVIVLAEAAELPEEINVERALQAKRRAEEHLYAPLRQRFDYVRARTALQRAINRLQVAKRETGRRGAPGSGKDDDTR